jgi:DNA-binding transcriptional LysR family regulator
MWYIHNMNNVQLDLNLLIVFDAILRRKSVSRAAEDVGLSQPAVSNALRRLRAQFADQLFVRIGSEMKPTRLADELGAVIPAALAQIRRGLERRRGFDALNERRTYTLIMTDIGEIVFLPRLLHDFREKAPDVSLRIVRLSARDTPRALESGEVDLAIGFMPDLKSGVYQQQLFTTTYVSILRKGHPAIRGRMTRDQFLGATHAVAEAAGTGHYVIEQQLQRLGVARRIGLRVPNFLALPRIIASTDMIATVPEQLADAFRSIPIRSVRHPIPFPPLPIKQFWHERYHDDPANRWLRQTCASLFQTHVPSGVRDKKNGR